MIQIKIDDPDSLSALAAAMEREAAERYATLAAAMRDSRNREAAQVFDRLAAAARSRANQLAPRSERELETEQPSPESIAWQTGEVWGLDGAELADPYTLTPYRALSIAVQNEERTFVYFSYVAAHADNPKVRDDAECLAREKLAHAAALRRHRRAAYHRERVGESWDRWRLRQRSPRRHDELVRTAAALEAGLAREHRRLAEQLRRQQPSAADLLTLLADEEDETAGRLARGAEPDAPASPTQDLRGCLLDLESVCDFYSRASEDARDEQAMALAQELTERTILRIARLRGQLDTAAA